MDIPPSLRALLHNRERERERLCETLARAWIPFQADSNDVSQPDGNDVAKLATDWNPCSSQSDTPEPEPPSPSLENDQFQE
jgi:hypothetical protein